MFKNPNYNAVVKKGPISFIKTSASPRHVNSAKAILVGQQNSAIDQYNCHQRSATLAIEIIYDKISHVQHLNFPFSPETTIGELIDFLHKELQEQHLYFRSRNLNLDYLLTLKYRKIKELSTNKLDLVASKIKIFPKDQFLSNF